MLNAGVEASVGDQVDDLGADVGGDALVAVLTIGSLGADLLLGLVVIVDVEPCGLGGGGVALDPEGLLDELQARVGVAAQLGQPVLAVGHRG